ncbi:MAG: serine/threonine protein kinase [Planctomycetes bacterium]|nr:serine/threonine protein kinase [Planctomycetota bacterium]
MSDAPPVADDAAFPPSSDEAWLDRLFGRLVDALGRAQAIDLDPLVAERPHLRAQAVELLALAREVALVRPVERPLIAGYELLAELGRGGMGTVYLALQQPLGRRVALKILPPTVAASARRRERFLREARAVASLEHESIVRLFEAGESDGVPYFSMEWIAGETVAARLAQLRARGATAATLSGADLGRARSESWPRAVAELLLELAGALDHAHARRVVHRDVKPSNVLLRPDGRALLFDFGLASVEAEATLTESGGFLGTPHYASPEQATGHADLDARSDLFSLGAMAYELLTLAPPFAGPTLQAILQAVREREPAPLAAQRHVPRDLATIVTTLLAKEPAHRYLSAAALADDLSRFLAGEPIVARPAGPLERAWRFARRRPALATALALALLLFGGGPTTLWLLQRGATRRIEAALRTSQEHASLLAGILESIDPGVDGREVTAFALLTRAADQLERNYVDQPEVRAAMQHTLAASFVKLGELERARPLLEAALATWRARAGDDDPRTIAVRIDHAVLELQSGHPQLALDLLLPVERWFEARGETASRAWCDTQATLAAALAGLDRNDEAIEKLTAAIAVAERSLRSRDRATLTLRHNLAISLYESGRTDEAIEQLEATWRDRAQTLGPDDHETLASLAMLPQLLGAAGRADEAFARSEEAIERLRRVLGETSPVTLVARHNHAGLLVGRDDLEGAEALQREVVALVADHLAVDDVMALDRQYQLLVILTMRGKWEEAARDAVAHHAAWCRALGRDHLSTRMARHIAALALQGAGRAGEAIALLEAERTGDPRDDRQRALDDPEWAEDLAILLERAGRKGESEALRALLPAGD